MIMVCTNPRVLFYLQSNIRVPMLQILRNKAQSTFIQAIVVVIALVFIFWGVGTNLMNNREAALIVNGVEISFQEFQQAYDRAYERMASQFGGTIPKGLAENLGIKQQVINQLIQTELLRQGAAAMGVAVSREEIREAVDAMPQFKENGVFSMEKYTSLLAANRLTATKFEANMASDMLTEKTIGAIGDFVTSAAAFEVEELYRQDNKKVAVRFVSVVPEAFSDAVQVEEATLKEWYTENGARYRTEPEIQLDYIAFPFDTVGAKIAIDETAAKEYYTANIKQYSTPEKRRARHILVRSTESDSKEVQAEKEQQAKEILALAKNTDDFAKLAQERSEGPSAESGGDLGFFDKNRMVPEFGTAVFDMQPGEISEVVKTVFGYHIIKLEEIQPASTKSFDEVKDSIIHTLQQKEAKPLAKQLATTAYEQIIGAGSIAAYGKANKEQPIESTAFFPRSAPPVPFAGDTTLVDKAFTLKAGELSSIIATSNGYFILFAKQLKEPETPPLADVIDQATKDFIHAKAVEKAKETADGILQKITAGESFADLGKEMGLSLENSGLLERNKPNDSVFPQELVAQVFALSKAASCPKEVGVVEETYYVYEFAGQEIPEITDETDLSRYQQMLTNNKKQELLNAFVANLQKKAKITQHRSL